MALWVNREINESKQPQILEGVELLKKDVSMKIRRSRSSIPKNWIRLLMWVECDEWNYGRRKSQ